MMTYKTYEDGFLSGEFVYNATENCYIPIYEDDDSEWVKEQMWIDEQIRIQNESEWIEEQIRIYNENIAKKISSGIEDEEF